MGDLKSNTIFYHRKCWTKLKRAADFDEKQMKEGDQTDSVLKCCQRFCMRKKHHYILETLSEKPSICVELSVIFERCKVICWKSWYKYNMLQGQLQKLSIRWPQNYLAQKNIVCWMEKDNKKLQYQQLKTMFSK